MDYIETGIPEEPYEIKEKPKKPCNWCNDTGIDPYTNEDNKPCRECISTIEQLKERIK